MYSGRIIMIWGLGFNCDTMSDDDRGTMLAAFDGLHRLCRLIENTWR
jgi:hypothetical protein